MPCERNCSSNSRRNHFTKALTPILTQFFFHPPIVTLTSSLFSPSPSPPEPHLFRHKIDTTLFHLIFIDMLAVILALTPQLHTRYKGKTLDRLA